MAPISRATVLARALRARPSTVRQSFNRLSRRSYASHGDHGAPQRTLQGDLPWAVGAVAVTAGGVWLLWPEPSAHGHGHDDHTEHKEEDVDEKTEDAGEETEQASKSGSESESESKEDENDGDEKKDKNNDEQKEEGSDQDDKSEKKSGTKQNPVVNEDRNDNNREVKYEDAKGGNKKRLESKNAVKQGNKDGSEGGSANVHSGSGEHVYNTDTKHSIDAQAEKGISNKGEGDAETAKLKRPVDPKRPQV